MIETFVQVSMAFALMWYINSEEAELSPYFVISADVIFAVLLVLSLMAARMG